MHKWSEQEVLRIEKLWIGVEKLTKQSISLKVNKMRVFLKKIFGWRSDKKSPKERIFREYSWIVEDQKAIKKQTDDWLITTKSNIKNEKQRKPILRNFIESAFSTKDTESTSEVHSYAYLHKPIIDNTYRQFDTETKCRSALASKNHSNKEFRKIVKKIWFEKVNEYKVKYTSKSLKANNSTLALNERSRTRNSIKIVPVNREVYIYNENEIFGNQLNSFQDKDLEVEDDWDTDDDILLKSKNNLIRYLSLSIEEYNTTN